MRQCIIWNAQFCSRYWICLEKDAVSHAPKKWEFEENWKTPNGNEAIYLAVTQGCASIVVRQAFLVSALCQQNMVWYCSCAQMSREELYWKVLYELRIKELLLALLKCRMSIATLFEHNYFFCVAADIVCELMKFHVLRTLRCSSYRHADTTDSLNLPQAFLAFRQHFTRFGQS